jgi:hypothetical protein
MCHFTSCRVHVGVMHARCKFAMQSGRVLLTGAMRVSNSEGLCAVDASGVTNGLAEPAARPPWCRGPACRSICDRLSCDCIWPHAHTSYIDTQLQTITACMASKMLARTAATERAMISSCLQQSRLSGRCSKHVVHNSIQFQHRKLASVVKHAHHYPRGAWAAV